MIDEKTVREWAEHECSNNDARCYNSWHAERRELAQEILRLTKLDGDWLAVNSELAGDILEMHERAEKAERRLENEIKVMIEACHALRIDGWENSAGDVAPRILQLEERAEKAERQRDTWQETAQLYAQNMEHAQQQRNALAAALATTLQACCDLPSCGVCTKASAALDSHVPGWRERE